MAALSAALLAPAFARPLVGIAAMALAVAAMFSIFRQRRFRPDFSLVSAAERRSYLAADTALTFSILGAVGLVLFLLISAAAAPIRLAAGHLALLWIVIAHTLRARLAIAHAAKLEAARD